MMGNNYKISPYALRIGGRTWYLTQGLERQLVDFLGTWVSPEASARYLAQKPRSGTENIAKVIRKSTSSERVILNESIIELYDALSQAVKKGNPVGVGFASISQRIGLARFWAPNVWPRCGFSEWRGSEPHPTAFTFVEVEPE